MNEIDNRKIYNYKGAIHIHSKFSDGSGDIEEISRAAKKAGLDFIIVTDHNNIEMKEGFFDGVCVIKGEEISPHYRDHYVALGIDKYIDFEQTPKDFVQEVRELGGFGFAAHPDESQSRKNKHKPIRWTDKSVTPDGVEIWNWFSQWADGYCDKNIFSTAYAFLFRHSLIKKPTAETLKWWDELNNNSEEVVPAIGGTDAHALKIYDYLLPLTIFPYKEIFETINNVINLDEELSTDFQIAKKQILDAIHSGKNLIINRKICKKIPEIYISNSNHRAYCGESVNFDNNCCINVRANNVFEIKLICNGIVIFETKAQSLCFPIKQKGKYRVELNAARKFDNQDKWGKGYAYTNPIVVV